MTMPSGKSSGQGRAFLGSAIGKAPAEPRTRAPLARREYRCSRCDARTLGNGLCSGCSAVESGDRPKPTLKRPSHGKARPGGGSAAKKWREACILRNVAMYGVATCEATGQHLEPDWSCHHVTEASVLNAMGLGSSKFIVWHPDNGMCVNRKPHLDHHNWSPRITADRLRDWHWDFARMLDDTQGTQAFTSRLERDYPEKAT